MSLHVCNQKFVGAHSDGQGGVYIHISSKWGMGVSKLVGPSTVRYGSIHTCH